MKNISIILLTSALCVTMLNANLNDTAYISTLNLMDVTRKDDLAWKKTIIKKFYELRAQIEKKAKEYGICAEVEKLQDAAFTQLRESQAHAYSINSKSSKEQEKALGLMQQVCYNFSYALARL